MGNKSLYLNFNCFKTQNIKFRKNAQTVDERIDDQLKLRQKHTFLENDIDNNSFH